MDVSSFSSELLSRGLFSSDMKLRLYMYVSASFLFFWFGSRSAKPKLPTLPGRKGRTVSGMQIFLDD